MTKLWEAIGLVACVATLVLSASAAKHNPAAVALFENAVHSSDLKTADGTFFRLQATLHVYESKRRIDGMFIEFWAPGKQERSEVLFSGYTYLEVADGHHTWKKTNNEYMPYPVSQLLDAMGFAGDMRTFVPPGPPGKAQAGQSPRQREWEQTELKKPKEQKRMNAECVKTKTSMGVSAQYCFDPATGHLTWILGTDLWFEYADYQAVGKKSFPRIMRVHYADGSEMAELQVTRLDPLENPDPTLFVPPAGSTQLDGNAPICGKSRPGSINVVQAKLLRKVVPVYPPEAKKRGISGTVLIHTVVGKDGVPHALWVLKSPSPLLSAAAIGAVAEWRYAPTTCPNSTTRIEVDTIITVIFTL